jgi:RHS repeat-associated protein
MNGTWALGSGGWGWTGTADNHLNVDPMGRGCFIRTDGFAPDQTLTLVGTLLIETSDPPSGVWVPSTSTKTWTFTICESDKCDDCGGSCSPPGPPGSPPGPPPHVPSLGTGRIKNELGPSLGFNLGAYSSDKDAGFIALNARVTTGNLYDPAALYVPYIVSGSNGMVEVITNSGKIAQVKSPQGLVNVNVINAYSFQLQNFYNSSVGSTNGSGLYTTTGSPFATWTITNANGSVNNNQLALSLTQSGVSDPHYLFTYTNVSGSNQWQLTDGSGLRTVSSWQAQDATFGTGFTNVVVQISSGGNVVQSITRTFAVTNGQSLLIRKIDGWGSATNTTLYFYTGNGYLQQVNYPEGNWVYYVYDGLNRVIQKFEDYLSNSSPPGSGVIPDVWSFGCAETDYTYDTGTVTGDAMTNSINVARLEQRFLPQPAGPGFLGYYNSIEVSRIIRACGSPDEIDEYRPPLPGGGYTDSGVLVTRAVTFWNPADVNTYGKTRWQVLADGTAALYTYTEDNNGVLTNITVQSGQPDNTISPSSIVNGSQTTTAINSLGQPTRVTTQPIVSSSTSYIVSQNTYSYSGALQDSYSVTDLANRTYQYNYACCGLDNTVDPDGVVTTYSYDVLRRQVASKVVRGSSGITMTNILDGAGRTLVSQRIGTDGFAMTLNKNGYDYLGNLCWNTNAYGGVTSYSNVVVNGQLCITNVNPDGGIRVEVHYSDGRLLTVTNSAIAPAIYQYGVEVDTGISTNVEYTLLIRSDGAGGTNEWVKTYVDGIGRQYKSIYSGSTSNPVDVSFYNGSGQLSQRVDPDGVTKLYGYNAKGERAYEAVDLNRNTNMDFTGSDRITFRTNDVVANHGTVVNRTQTYAWSANSIGTSNLISTIEISTNGLWSWTTLWNNGAGIVSQTALAYSVGGNRVLTNTSANNSYVVNAYQYGLLTSQTKYDANGQQIGQLTYSYDAQGRQASVADVRTGPTTYTYNSGDSVSTALTPSPGLLTQYFYDSMGRQFASILSDGTAMTNAFYPTSLPKLTYGSRTYAAGYSYDAQGRTKTMTNWSNFSTLAGARVTTWNYEFYRGLLSSKTYDGAVQGPAYGYTGAGRLATRLWARGTNSAYSYNVAGDLASVTYNDATTPTVSYGYDRRGRQNAITNGSAICNLTLNDAGSVLSEAYSGTGPLSGMSVTNGYDGLLRRTNNVALNGTTVLAKTTNSWDAASRLLSVGDGVGNLAAYSYVANSPLVGQISFTNSGSLRMTATKTYDNLNRLVSVASLNAQSAALDSHLYTYNSANQRVRQTLADGSSWQYIYDSLGQVTSGHHFFADATPVAGQQFDFAFDTIGNRTQVLAGGDATGGNQRQSTYTSDTLNRYSQRTVPGFADIIGVSLATNSMTVAGLTPYRKNEYFRQQVPVSNGSGAVWTNITVSATGQSSIGGNVFVPAATETYGYDADGNLTNDGRWSYSWDAENRLISMQGQSGLPTGAKLKLDFVYDWQSRRIQKMVSTNNGSAYGTQTTNRFLYDGWNTLAILNPASQVLQAFVWGCDLSGSSQGAGGVGGLLVITDSTNGAHFALYDGNGNITGLSRATDASASGSYEYGPFSEVIRSTGPMSKANPFRFSTKYQDEETDLVYYGKRYLSASTGRWVNRDPIEERGGLNVYALVGNDPIQGIDQLGLRTCCCKGQMIDGKPVLVFKYCTGKSPSGDVDHAWIEMDDSSAGFYPTDDGGFRPGGIPVSVPGQVNIPESDHYLNHSGKSCREVKYSPCDVDIVALKAMLWNTIWVDHFNPPTYNVVMNNCFDWAAKRIIYASMFASSRKHGCGNDSHEFE